MKNVKRIHLMPVLMVALILTISATAPAQETGAATPNNSQLNAVQVQTGQRLKVEGTILQKKADGLTLLCPGGVIYNVAISNTTGIKERKVNPFRGSKTYSPEDLVQGLRVEVEGTGDSSGTLVAREIKLRNDDLELAQTMDTRVVPVEKELQATQTRLSETEQNALRLSGQVQEISDVSNSARTDAKKAQESADRAMSAANNARTFAEEGVQSTNKRITSLDDYEAKNTVIVNFNLGSAVLSETAKSELRGLAGQLSNEKGYLIEIAGFASSDGDAALNRRLSQKRADAVIQFLADNFSIPLRRFVTPLGYGENQPIADNQTIIGRRQNRRVEVRIVANKGLMESDPAGKEMAGAE